MHDAEDPADLRGAPGAGAGLDDIALQWVVRISSGRMTPAERKAYALWRGTSPRHERAAQEAEALWENLGAAGHTARRQSRGRTLTRRAALGGGAAVVLGGVLYGGGFVPRFPPGTILTALGERRELRLEDGSQVEMNADTALSVDLVGTARNVTLWQGQAVFRVVRDPARPFTVEAGRGVTRAIGTAFDVDLRRSGVVVTVLEGEVGVRGRDPGEIRLPANHSVGYQADGAIGPMVPVDAEAETAWRHNRLIFNDRALGDVIAAVQRYRPGRIYIPSEAARSMPVTGSFSLADPDRILDIIEATLPVRVRRLPYLTIIS